MEINLDLWEKQFEFVFSKERSVLLQCGVGYGKTFSGCVFILMCLQDYHNCSYMIVSRDVPQFKKAVLPEFLKALEMFNYDEGQDYNFNRSSNTFYFKKEKVTIFCVGAQNYDSAFRGPNISVILSDETEYYKPEAWTAMLGRLRKHPELLRCTSTPNGFNHVYDYFKDRKVLVAPTWENKTLSTEYIENLRSAYSPKLFAQEVEAKRLLLNVGQVYDEFKEKDHVKPCKHLLEKTDQLYFFTDYNISNYCGVYMFKKNNHIYCWGEEHLKFKGTEELAQRIKAAFPDRAVIVIGDSSGNNKRDVSTTQTNYQIFQKYGVPTKHAHNPPVQTRIITTQSNLHHGKITLDPSCKNLIRDLNLVSWLENGKDIDKSDISLSHSSDAFGYGVCYFLPIHGESSARIKFM